MEDNVTEEKGTINGDRAHGGVCGQGPPPPALATPRTGSPAPSGSSGACTLERLASRSACSWPVDLLKAAPCRGVPQDGSRLKLLRLDRAQVVQRPVLGGKVSVGDSGRVGGSQALRVGQPQRRRHDGAAAAAARSSRGTLPDNEVGRGAGCPDGRRGLNVRGLKKSLFIHRQYSYMGWNYSLG